MAMLISTGFSQMRIDTREFILDPNSSLVLPNTQSNLNKFMEDAPTEIKAELKKNRYKSKIDVIEQAAYENALLSYNNSILEGKIKVREIQVKKGANAVVSGVVLFRENKRPQISMGLYMRKAIGKDTVYIQNTKSIMTRKSINFLERDEKAGRMIRRMTRKLLGQGLLTTQAEYAVTGAGVALLGAGTVLFVSSNNRYKTYEKHPYVLDPVFDEFSGREDPREAFYEDLKKDERLSFVMGGLGLAMTAFGTYEIILSKKSKNNVYDYLIDDGLSFEDSKSEHTLTIGSDISYNPITTRTDPELKLTYRF